MQIHAKVMYVGNLTVPYVFIPMHNIADRDLVKKNPILRCRADERDAFASNGNVTIFWIN